MQTENFPEIMKNHPLFRGLQTNQIELVIALMKQKKFSTGQVLVREGETTTDLLILISGKVKLIKKITDSNEQMEIGQLEPYATFGDISFIDESMTRTLSVVALVDSIALILKRDDLQELAAQHFELVHQITKNIAKINFDRLNKTNQNYVQSLLKSINELKLREQFGRFFAFVVAIASVSGIITSVVQSHILKPSSEFFTWTYLIIALIPILLIIRSRHFSLSEFGVTLQNWPKVLIESVGIAFFLSVVLIFIVVMMRNITHQPQIFTTRDISFLELLLYIPHSYLQEFIARGVSQTLLVRFLNDKRGYKSILITAIVFADIHLYISWLAAAGGFVFSIIFGMVYLRQKNLIGVSFIHLVIGTVATFLGILY